LNRGWDRENEKSPTKARHNDVIETVSREAAKSAKKIKTSSRLRVSA
jgi:hypothetical protein